MDETAVTSVAVPKKILKRLHAKSERRPLHVVIEAALDDQEFLRVLESKEPDLVARVRREAVPA
jgi:hypothetical protein